MALREAADAAHERLAAQNAEFHDVCGDLYAGAETDVTALRAALDWARRLRTMITGGTGPLTPAHLKAAESAVPTPRLPAADEAWHQARDALMTAFDPTAAPTSSPSSTTTTTPPISSRSCSTTPPGGMNGTPTRPPAPRWPPTA